MKHVWASAILATAAGAAQADEVVLRNGARFEGHVKENDKTVTVVMDFGSVTFKRIDVARIDRGPSPITDFDAKLAEVKAEDLDGRCRLAVWAKQRGLDQRAQQLFEDILARNPNHAGAREGLGYKKVDDRWLSEADYKLEQGLVLFRGEWMSRETADGIRLIEAQRAAEIARIAVEGEMRIKEIEAETSAMRAAEEEARQSAEAGYDFGYRLPLYYPPWYGFPGNNCRPGIIRPFRNTVGGPSVKPAAVAVVKQAPASRSSSPFVRKTK